MPQLKLTLDVSASVAAAYQNASSHDQKRVQKALEQKISLLEVLQAPSGETNERLPKLSILEELHPEVVKMIGLAPEQAELKIETSKDEYYDYMMKKHR